MSFALLVLLAAGSLVVGPSRAHAETGDAARVVWMVCDVSGKSQVTVRLPLEWLAACDRKGTIRIEDGEPLHCAELWNQYKGLGVGESREVRHAVDKEGEPYVLRVESLPPLRDRAQGRVHIVTKDERGKKVDIAFPLDLPKLVETIANVFAGFFGGDSARVQINDLSISNPADLKRLADYGRFVFLDTADPDSSAVRITIE
jgi:hypothetical protein